MDEKAYLELKSKEEIESAASSFGKILFKKPNKKGENMENTDLSNQTLSEKKTSEIDFIFNLDQNGIEIPVPDASSDTDGSIKGKILLDQENKDEIKYGLQEPPIKKRYIDGPTSKVTSKTASKVLSYESKCNKKLLSFNDEEDELSSKISSDEG